MRIGTNSRYTMMQYHQNKTQNSLDGVLAQMNGLKIQYGYQDASVFNKTLSLDFNINTLTQSKELANNAFTFTQHTDTALKDLAQTMDNFKQKLVQGANDIHSETSRLAIAKDLKALRDHFLSVANTSIGGEFIFGGTATTKQPFNANGSYNGNSDSLSALLGSNNLVSYNVTGAELFFGSDRDTNRVISTNIPKFNQSKLHPEIMDPLHKTGQGEEVYLKASDPLRDLVGDSDNKTDNDPSEVFYITGRKPDGTAFKTKFEMQVSYTNEKQAPKVQDLLDKIGREFGNTEVSKVVDVTLNAWGQIEIKDLTSGRSNIEFSMISSSYKDPANAQVNPNANPPTDGIGIRNIDQLLSTGVKVNTYVQSPFLGDFSNVSIASVEDYNDHRIHTLPTTFRTPTNEIAKTTTLLRDVFPAGVTALQLSGNAANTAPDTPGAQIQAQNFTITQTSTIQDLMDRIKQEYSVGGGNIDVQFSDGKIIVVDNNVSKKTPADQDDKDLPYTGASSLSITLTAQNGQGGQNVNGFRSDYGVDFDRVNFSRNGATLKSNVSQIVRATNEYATLETKLSEVAGTDLNGHTYNFKVKDVNGLEITGRIDLTNNNGSSMTITSPANVNGINIPNNVQVPILQANGNPPQVSGNPTPANDVTYQQLADILGMVLNLSNSNPQDLTNVFQANANFNTPGNKASYEAMLSNAKNNLNITLDANGALQIKDLHKTPTKMEFSLFDSKISDFTLNAQGRIDEKKPALTFQSNSAIIADDPHINFFEQIDVMIEALEVGSYRAGGVSVYGDAMRNPGVQNAMLVFDHLADHINKVHTKNGAQGNAFKYSIERTEVLIVQAKTLRSDTIDTDFAEAYLQFSTLSIGYQAMLSSIGKITQLSLVNYL
ncbi:flagellar hook-associated protein FlgL [Helicobacter sp.]|uniref:flagellar hook-associated protein FlgL n=1 Tax=Helicobacter sp. TaxID=218 RepID=UPI0025BBCBD2|nr:flagellar hook-associated protein FlgL [Helicobacter sp.]MCI5969426.1 flagellar hook-associated protein FlgL [Helicobacter sp.]MDY2585681.1 flagellar hook-associated protein FlgL [Helicobacter sp.]